MCPVPDAKQDAAGCESGPASPPSELALLTDAVLKLTAAMDRRDRLLMNLLQQNAAILDALVDASETPSDEDPPTHYLSGAPITC